MKDRNILNPLVFKFIAHINLNTKGLRLNIKLIYIQILIYNDK